MTVRTCTKVNIGLNVLRRRPDGYHDLETLFVPYHGFGDVLSVEPAEALSIEIEREGGVDWDPMQDLTVRAWRLLKADFPQLPEVSIHLEKHAPVGAGLGGGSADAAFMLRALNDLAGLGLDDAALASYAARLGSDCAFFIRMKKLPSTIPLHPQGTEGRSPQTPPSRAAPKGLRLFVELFACPAGHNSNSVEPFQGEDLVCYWADGKTFAAKHTPDIHTAEMETKSSCISCRRCGRRPVVAQRSNIQ